MRIAITGGTGFIGRHLASALTASGHEVILIARGRDDRDRSAMNYFQAQDAEFLLTRLPNGRTLLTGSSRYRNRMWLVAYWRLWSDAIVHQIHLRVFRHVKHQAEMEKLEAKEEMCFVFNGNFW